MSRSVRPGLSARWVALRAELDADRPAWWVTRVVGPGDPAGPGGPPAADTGNTRVEAAHTDATARRPVQRPARRSQTRGSSRSRFVVAAGTTVAVVVGFVLGSLAVQGWAAWTHTESRVGGVRGGVLTVGSDATFATPVTGLTAGTSQVGTRYLEVRNDGDVDTGDVQLSGTGAVSSGVTTSWSGFASGGTLTTPDTAGLDHGSSIMLQVTLHTALVDWSGLNVSTTLASKSGEWRLRAHGAEYTSDQAMIPEFEWTDPSGRVCSGTLGDGELGYSIGSITSPFSDFYTTYTWYRATVSSSGSGSYLQLSFSNDGSTWNTLTKGQTPCAGVANSASPVVVGGATIPELHAFTLAYDGASKASITPTLIPTSSSFTGTAGETWSSTATQQPAGVLAAAPAALDARIAVCTAGWAYQSGNPTCSSWTVVSGGWVPLADLATAGPLTSSLAAGGRLGVRVEVRGGLAEAAAADAGIGVDELQGVGVTVTWQLMATAHAGCAGCA